MNVSSKLRKWTQFREKCLKQEEMGMLEFIYYARPDNLPSIYVLFKCLQNTKAVRNQFKKDIPTSLRTLMVAVPCVLWLSVGV